MSWRIFEGIAREYDSWYDRNWEIYQMELSCINSLIGKNRGSPCLEVGVGTGRFAEPLGIEVGLDAALSPLLIARKRGIEVVQGLAENLPFTSSSFRCSIMVVTLCFIKDPLIALKEIKRVLRRRGELYLCFIPRESPMGRKYTIRGLEGDPIYSKANFLRRDEVLDLLSSINMLPMRECHTLIDGGVPNFICMEAIST